jgi:hypothetical protein
MIIVDEKNKDVLGTFRLAPMKIIGGIVVLSLITMLIYSSIKNLTIYDIWILGVPLVIGTGLFIGIPVIIDSMKKNGFIIFFSNKNVNEKTDKKLINKNYRDVLLENDLGEYIDLFEKNKLTDMIIISELSDVDLEKIGITIMGDRKKILRIFSAR